jgi:hydrogenase nickel incorporation protein HypA/HybF
VRVNPVHELAICQALMEQVERIAREERAERVLSIHLAIGPLSGVEPRLLEQAFYVARAGSIAANAELVTESMPIQVSCNQCGQLSDALPSRLLCGHCGDWRTKLVSGDEMNLLHIELVRQTTEETTEARIEQQQFN